QAVKHHCANMLVGAESAIAAVWDASRAASEDLSKDEAQFRLAAASAAALAFPAYARNSELNIQVHGGIGFTWEHDAHLHLRRALVTAALFGGDAPARDVFERTAAGAARENSLDLPPEAEELRTRIRADAAEIAALDKQAQRDKLIETGYVMPHWPKPWGLAADAVEQLVIEEEFRAAGIKRTDYGITGWADFNEVFFNDLFVPDEDVVGEPNTGWTVARATLGNERVSIGGSGSFYAGLATQLVEQIKAQPDRLAGGRTRVGRYLAEENVLRLLNLRRVARSVEGA